MKHNVALITPGFAADEQDSVCIPALQVYVAALRRRHPEIGLHIVAQHYPDRRAPYRWHGIDVTPIGAGRGRIDRTARTMAALAGAARRTGGFAAVHSFWLGECAALGRLWARMTGARHIVTLMGQEVCFASGHQRIIGRRGTTTVAVSAFQDGVLRETIGRGADAVIPWGIEVPPPPRGDRDVDVVGLASLSEVKAPERFVRVVAALARLRPGLRACWIGDGPLREEMEALATALGVGESLVFTGTLDRDAALALLARSRVLLHTARFESFCMALAEAQSLGVATVSRGVGIAEPGPGSVIAESEEAMVAAVDALLAADPPAPRVRYPIEATVQAYHARYFG